MPWGKRLAGLEELAEGVPLRRSIGGKEFLVVRRGERVSVCGNRCPHQGATLSEGILSGEEVVCPCHGARFDLRDGRLSSPPALDGIPVYQVRVEGREVFVGPVREENPFPPAGPAPPAAAEVRGRGSAQQGPARRGSARRGGSIGIVGAGAAGHAAAEELRRAGFAGRIVLIGAEPDPPYDRTALSKGFLAGEIPAETLPLRGRELYEQLSIELLLGCRVAGVEPGSRTAVLADGRRLAFERLLLATGGLPRRLPIPGADLPGCFLLRSRSDGQALRAAVREAQERGGEAVILGAGLIGLEVAASLRRAGLAAAVIAPEEIPLAAVFGERVGAWIRRLHEEKGVRFHLGRTVREIRGDGRVREVALSDGTRLAAEVVVIGAGIVTAVEYLAGTGLVRDGEVAVDGRLETAAPGLYAAGDIARVPGARGGRPERVEHWASAQRQGRHAARAMLGAANPYAEAPFFWTDQFDRSLKRVGPAGGWDRIVYRGAVEAGDFLAGYFLGDRLVAAAAAGACRTDPTGATYAGAAFARAAGPPEGSRRDREIMALGELLRCGAGARPAPGPQEFQDEGVDLVSRLAG
jgi:NADPH-dependent 2,4-dienoyl-CoA reductase/sulfur reductase-like enzyme/nitrite reductase/ring-hydroxylating ferredoxin subunit